MAIQKKTPVKKTRRRASPKLSVVVATFNRGPSLVTLLKDLAEQNIDPKSFEVIINDDGSTPPVRITTTDIRPPYQLTLLRQDNAGPAKARHRAILKAKGEIVVVIDDDMRLPKDFLEQHMKAHAQGLDVVLGHIKAAPHLDKMPIFERFHAGQLDSFVRAISQGKIEARGVHVCTGNVSMRRADYLKTGGFDSSLKRSEDRELGIRLEKLGAKLGFSLAAATLHHSDHTSLKVWLTRAFNYGFFDSQIAEKHPDTEYADPWRFFFLISPVSRPLMLGIVAVPQLGAPLSRALMGLAMAIDSLGVEKPALLGTTLAYGVEYFRGVREAKGSLREALRGLWRHRQIRNNEDKMKDKKGALVTFLNAVREDFASVQRNRAKYHHQGVPSWQMPVKIVQKIGLQMATAIRVMHLCRDSGLPLLPEISSRMIRHLYGAEIHWDADIAPGISIVHGNGLVISHAAKIKERCILFHNVTLGQGIDPKTREMGAPTLEEDVHVGPGATILGPITVGAGTKIMAGAVLAESVPPRSLVMPTSAVVTKRAPCESAKRLYLK